MNRFCLERIVFALLVIFATGWTQESKLWGSDGKEWSPTSRLPGFAWSGFKGGSAPLPIYPVSMNVRQFGAKGDGTTDDTAAFIKALETAPPGSAVFVPEGRFVITKVLRISRSNIVLRGKDPEKSILVMPKSLTDVERQKNPHAYSITGAFIVISGDDLGKPIGKVIAAAKRGDMNLAIEKSSRIRAGDCIRITMRDTPKNSLTRHLYGGLEPGAKTDDLKLGVLQKQVPVDWAAQVVAVTDSTITLDRPLRFDVRLEWKPQLIGLDPDVTGSGIEHLGFEFPGTQKPPHLEESGFNAIQLTNVVNCWIRDVVITDADNGILVNACRFCTIDQVTTRAAKRKALKGAEDYDLRAGFTGHHAIWAYAMTQECLFTRFRCETMYRHDLSVEGFAVGNVFTKGSGVAINCDHHRNGPYENCFTDIDVGNPKRLFESSGDEDRGPHSGTRTTFWGIRGTGTFPNLPSQDNWPQLNVVGFGKYPTQASEHGFWIESCEGSVTPENIWEAQVKRLRR